MLPEIKARACLTAAGHLPGRADDATLLPLRRDDLPPTASPAAAREALLYCPTNPVTRAQMAVFLLKSKHGSGYVPPARHGHGLRRRSVPTLSRRWIEELASRGHHGGCGGGNYCPDDPVTRKQMAVVPAEDALRLEPRAAGRPPRPSRTCPDAEHASSHWIKELYGRGITGGCALRRCATAPTTRTRGPRWRSSWRRRSI